MNQINFPNRDGLPITGDMVCQSCYNAMAADQDFQGDLQDYIVVISSSDCIGCFDQDA